MSSRQEVGCSISWSPPRTVNYIEQKYTQVCWYAGEHETTRLCLQWLFANRQKLQGAHVMDYGTGSGVVAVAALLMGAASAVCLHAG